MRYIQGYELGAQSVNPAIVVKTAYVTNDFSNAAFNDPVGGKTFAQTFITSNKPDVLFQVAGKTGNGVLDAACAANIYGIGVDVDQCAVLPERRQVHRDQRREAPRSSATGTAIQEIAGGHRQAAGDVLFNAKNDGIGVSPTSTTRRA